MIDKAVYIVIFFYAVSFMMLGVQYVLGDVYHIQMTNLSGTPIKSAILEIIQTDILNSITANIANATDAENGTLDAIVNAFQLGYNVGKEIALLLTGTYIFNIMYLFQIPAVVIAGFVVLYAVCVALTLIAKIRGI